MQFTRSKDSDVKAVCLAIAEGLPEYFTKTAIPKMAKDLEDEELFVAQDANEVTGFVCAKQRNLHVCEILWMAVRAPLNGHGIGTFMMDSLCRHLESRKVGLVMVKTLAPTVDYAPYALTRRFYEKNGFVLVDVIDPYPAWDPGNPCAIYVKAL